MAFCGMFSCCRSHIYFLQIFGELFRTTVPIYSYRNKLHKLFPDQAKNRSQKNECLRAFVQCIHLFLVKISLSIIQCMIIWFLLTKHLRWIKHGRQTSCGWVFRLRAKLRLFFFWQFSIFIKIICIYAYLL